MQKLWHAASREVHCGEHFVRFHCDTEKLIAANFATLTRSKGLKYRRIDVLAEVLRRAITKCELCPAGVMAAEAPRKIGRQVDGRNGHDLQVWHTVRQVLAADDDNAIPARGEGSAAHVALV